MDAGDSCFIVCGFLLSSRHTVTCGSFFRFCSPGWIPSSVSGNREWLCRTVIFAAHNVGAAQPEAGGFSALVQSQRPCWLIALKQRRCRYIQSPIVHMSAHIQNDYHNYTSWKPPVHWSGLAVSAGLGPWMVFNIVLRLLEAPGLFLRWCASADRYYQPCGVERGVAVLQNSCCPYPLSRTLGRC